MSRLAGFSLALLLSFAGAARAQDTAPEPVDLKDGRVLWIEPLGTVLGLALSDPQGESGEALTVISGGYAHPLDERRALALELLVAHEEAGCRGSGEACSRSTLVRASAGLAYSYGGSPGRGFLFQPRLILGYYHAAGVSLQAGLDVGYQWRAGPVYLALVGGLAAGVSTVGLQLPPFVTTDPPFTKGGLGLRPMLGLNLQLLRLGFSF